MRLAVRSDLGGYAAALPQLAAVAKVGIEKPFVLLCGHNGSGKTALLHMLRNAIGLSGARAGRAGGGEFERLLDPEEAGGDPGKLAAWRGGFARGKMPDKSPGVLDLGALGWAGQRTWLFDSRGETEMLGSSAFDEDIGYHAAMLVGGAKRASHGQALRHGWTQALRWGAGGLEAPDPYDEGRRLPPARRELLKLAMGDAKERPAERWLLLDEPEVALDAEAQFLGFATLIRHAAPGRLRVFCASHSPLFAAGLADDPNVQVLDLGGEARPWFAVQKAALIRAADPAALAKAAEDVALRFRIADLEEKVRAREAFEAKVDEALKGLTPRLRGFLVAALSSPKHALDGKDENGKAVGDAGLDSLDHRGLARVEGFARKRTGFLTELGVAAARRLAGNEAGTAEGAKEAKPKRPAKAPTARKRKAAA